MIRGMLAALGSLAGVVTARLGYRQWLERRAQRRRTLGPGGIIAGAESIEKRGGPHAVLLLHGAGDTPQSLAGLADYLHARGYSVRAPLLPAHGRALSGLALASSDAWWEHVKGEHDLLRRDHEWLAVVGLSMGGALAVRLAAERSAEVAALVLLAPYLEMPSYARRIARSGAYWGWLLPYIPSLGRRSIRDPAAAEKALGHGLLTPALLRALLETVANAGAALPRVQVPTLVVHSRSDNRISQAAAERTFAALGAREKKLVWMEGAGHVITVDFGYEIVFETAADWLDAQRAAATAVRGGSDFRRRS